MQNEKNIRDALRAVLEKLIEVAPTAEQEWPELVRRAKDALASGDVDPAWEGVCAACSEGIPPKRCAYYGEPDGCNAPTLGKHPEGDLAERLQEELEKAERRIAEPEHAPGNAAALREALEECRDYLYDILRDAFHDAQVAEQSGNPSMDGYEREQKLHKAVEAALSAPARNCDRFATEDEAREAYWAYREPLEFNNKPFVAITEWLFAPAEGGAE